VQEAKKETAAGREAAKVSMAGGAVEAATGSDVTLATLRGDIAQFRKLQANGQIMGALKLRHEMARRLLQTAANGKDVKGFAREMLAATEAVDLFELLRKVP
jgi:predicted acetyltransferase